MFTKRIATPAAMAYTRTDTYGSFESWNLRISCSATEGRWSKIRIAVSVDRSLNSERVDVQNQHNNVATSSACWSDTRFIGTVSLHRTNCHIIESSSDHAVRSFT